MLDRIMDLRKDRSNKWLRDEINGQGFDGLDDDATATRKDGDLLGLCVDHLNNDFEHQCFEEAYHKLHTSLLEEAEGDIGPRMLKILGIPQGRFLPHQIWGI